MISLEQLTGIEQIDRMLPFLRYDNNGMNFWCLPNALDYENAVSIGGHMGMRYCWVVRQYPDLAVQLSDVLLSIDLRHENNKGYLIGFAYSLDNLLRKGGTG
ncbi:hypothetical protein [Shewanella sp. MEBiC00475]|uniref:hypothetical protein n=1 Tax=Shewanella sp. MEBiC00475 TaxID=2575361 RepID=UPI0010BFC956|nr:hypothetical protein [Shewanella sp. MEBiC00475]